MRFFCLFLILGSWTTLALGQGGELNPRNVLMIAIDDLNDWIGCMGGHPQARTPNLDALAERGLLFTNAHVQATYCGPSRISVMSGRMPGTTGCYGFSPSYDQAESLKGHPALHEVFAEAGLLTVGGGKLFHKGLGAGHLADQWDVKLSNARNPSPSEQVHWPVRVWDWGAFPESDDEMGDFKLAKEVAEIVGKKQDQPFFVAAGFRRPHVPLHVPAKWFDLYPIDEVRLPETMAEDLGDVPHPEISTRIHAQPDHSEIVEKDLWKGLVQAYLASISFVDHCVGTVVDALNEGPNAQDTMIVLWSDHGFHLGEKHHWAKRTLWEETTRVPMMVIGDGIPSGVECAKPVGLIDLYPTLCEVIGAAPPEGLEGQSLVPLMQDPEAEWDHMAITTLEPGSHSIRSEHWRYIRYRDGSEELYDHRVDSNEWRNLADLPAHANVKAAHEKWLPEMNRPDVNGDEITTVSASDRR